MTMPPFIRAAASASLSFTFVLLALAAARAAAPPATPVREPGDLWEVTSRMSMEGMPAAMGAQTHKVCSPKTWTEPPGAKADDRCEIRDFRNTATKSTWSIVCPGPPAMTGTGEITRTSSEAWKGTMKFTSDEGSMTMALDGRRVGDCDTAAARRDMDQRMAQAEAVQRQGEDMQKQMQAQQHAAMEQRCAEVGASLDLKQVRAIASYCNEAVTKNAFCKRLESPEGFAIVCRDDPNQPTSLMDAAAYCGKDPEAIRKPICEEALANELLEPLGRCCPAQAAVVAERECAGRKYTEMTGSKYQSFCVTYARDTMADAQKDGQKDAKKTKKGFKIPWPR